MGRLRLPALLIALTIVFNIRPFANISAAQIAEPPPSAEQLERHLQTLAGKQQISNPSLLSEWTVFGLARSGFITQDYKRLYITNLQKAITATKGVLARQGAPYSVYARVVLALTALGTDPANISGKNLLAPLAEFENVNKHGILGTAYALIALNSRNYVIPALPAGSDYTQTTRENLTTRILSSQNKDGGWANNPSPSALSDINATAMAIQALAPRYNTDETTRTAIDKALVNLSQEQNNLGGYGSADADAQVIIAITSVGKTLNDPLFVKNESTIYNDLMRHVSDGVNQTATDLTVCALASLRRALVGMNSLYDLTDVSAPSAVLPPQSLKAYISVIDSGAKAGQKSVYFAGRYIEFEQGETAFDLLMKTGLSVQSVGDSANGAYVSSIDGFGEFSDGALSGWLFKVNGEFLKISAGSYELQDGDWIEWVYTRDLGADVNAPGVISQEEIVSAVSILKEDDHTLVEVAFDISADMINKNASKHIDSTLLSETLLQYGQEKNKALNRGAQNVYVNVKYKIIGADNADSTAISFAYSDLRLLAAQTDISLTFESALGSVTFDNTALIGLTANGTGGESTQIVLRKAELIQNDLAALELAVLTGERTIEKLGGGTEIYIPFIADNDIEKYIVQISIGSDQTSTDDAHYDHDKKGFIFKTNLCGRFGIAIKNSEPEQIPAEPEKKTDDGVELLNPYSDVPDDAWYYFAVQYVSNQNIMSGIGGGLFAPQRPMSRAMLVTVLHRLAGVPNAPGDLFFTDARMGEWYTEAIIWAKANGIANGYSDALFGTDDAVTREQLASILYNYALWADMQINQSESLLTYYDAALVSDYARNAMQWAHGVRLMVGRDSKVLAPQEPSTRAEVAQVLMKFSGLEGTND